MIKSDCVISKKVEPKHVSSQVSFGLMSAIAGSQIFYRSISYHGRFFIASDVLQ